MHRGSLKKLALCFCSLTGCAASSAAQNIVANPSATQAIKQPSGTEFNANRSKGIVFADQYPTIQAAINDAPVGGEIYVPAGTYAQGANPITVTGKWLVCAPGAVITFSGLNSTTDAVTLGWADSNSRTGVEGCIFDANASGRDGMQISGGNHWFMRNITFRNFARDCMHVEPDKEYDWSENSTVANLHCYLSISPASTLRDGIRVAIGDKFQPAPANVYVNEAVWQSINIRAYGGNAIHFYMNSTDPQANFITHQFIDVHTDADGHESSPANPAIFFEVAKGHSNPMSNFNFLGGGSEDTARTPTGPIFKASNQSVGDGVTTIGFVNGNFPHFFDTNFLSAFNWAVLYLGPNNSWSAFPTQYVKDGTPTQAGAIGLQVPGRVPGNDLTLSLFNRGVWTPRLVALAAGGFSFKNAAGNEIASIDNNGNMTLRGNFKKSGGSSRIDHLFDPEDKLSPSAVESPDMMNIYNGIAILDDKGEAWVRLPEYFAALNCDFRYQLTAVGSAGPNLHIARKVLSNRFKIGGGKPHAEVSWQVTGIRQDPYASADRITAEESKPVSEHKRPDTVLDKQ